MNAVVLTVRGHPVRVARVEQCLRWNAADGDAYSAHTIPLDHCDLRAFDGGVERRDVPAGAAAEDRDVVRGHYEKSLGSSDASRSNGCSVYRSEERRVGTEWRA